MRSELRIAVASGKGGTGKTTIATNLAVALAETGARVAYVDCDVEEPNGHIFLRPVIDRRREVSIPIPEVDEARCNRCGACGRACRYSAIAVLPNKILTFPKLCHGCGGCTLSCPVGAIREVSRKIGTVETGMSGQLIFVHGKLDVGEAMAPPVIRAVLEAVPENSMLVLDAPPGTSCPVIETVKTADVVLLVAESTPFGLNDLSLAVDMVRQLGVPFGVAINRAGVGDRGVFDYCARERIPILLEIPNDLDIARAYSRGELAMTALPNLAPLLVELYGKLVQLSRDAPARVAGPSVNTLLEDPKGDMRPSEMVQIGGKNGAHELVVLSGKGGTGKTSIAASFFALAENGSVADCDVDAADLHLVLDPTVRSRHPFSSSKKALIDATRCTGCGICGARCRFGALRRLQNGRVSYVVDALSCEGCGVCVDVCPSNAISLIPQVNGEWLISDTRHGPMTHARLGIAQENSGKLVAMVRQEAKALSALNHRELVICDGSPGIGCPVISSIVGARMVLVVTEPTLSGLHDLKRIVELCRQLDVKTAICINKADLNLELSAQIEAEAASQHIPVLGRIRYDESVTAAQVKRKAVVESGDGPAAMDIRALWVRVKSLMELGRQQPEKG